MHQSCMSRYLKSIEHSQEGVDCPYCRTNIPPEKCPCKFITFFNAIDYVSNKNTRCEVCSKFIHLNAPRSCECERIDCLCKHSATTSANEFD
jgi:hypothetical protein